MDHESELARAANATQGLPHAALEIAISASPRFAQLLAEQKMSLVVSTYEAGALVILRAVGDTLNVHLLRVDRAMGVAANAYRLAVGMRHRIMELCNVPALGPHLPVAESGQPVPDACYMPLQTHVTGEIDIHEMAWGGDELWFVNTRFSCLCTRDALHSFVPRWRPPFVKGLSADDRCHLNGIAMLGNRPSFVTAFAVSDEPEGWRSQRTTGGILMEVASGEVVAKGLSMPHSPRFHGNDLWLLESGKGSLARIDSRTAKLETVAVFPGFTRGLDFAGNYAFVGLSKVRDSASFGGAPVTDRIPESERFCGVQVLNLATGQQEAFLRFESGVSEVFAVQTLPGIRFPAFLDENDPLLAASYMLSPDALRQLR